MAEITTIQPEAGIKPKRGKFNKNVYLEAIRAGLNKTEAGRKAGLTAKEDKNIIKTVEYNIQRDTVLKKDILKQYEALEQRLMNAIKKKDMSKAQVNQLIVAMAITRDKIQLISGQETQRIGIKPIIIGETPLKADIPEQIKDAQ